MKTGDNNMPEEFFRIESISDVKSIFVHFFPVFYKKKQFLKILSLCAYRLPRENRQSSFNKKIKLNDDYYETKFLFKRGLNILNHHRYSYFINFYIGKINVERLVTYSPQNLFMLSFKNSTHEIIMPAVYNIIYLTKNYGKTGKVYKINDNQVCYFRQANKNSIGITIRKPNVTDLPAKKWLIFWAHLFALFMPKSNRILLYEKESNKYEESAAVLYEKLIDLGYQNCYFLLNKNSNHVQFIKEKYQKNIIWLHSFKHYYNFFRCQKFMGSESLTHAVELRTANEYITRKIIRKRYRYVFLQHGVMYMVSLNARGRGAFIKGKEMPRDAKIIVSSQKEAEHFIQLADFNNNDLYITGLPLYDRTIKHPQADKIVIILTWRAWEYNIIDTDYKKAGYYQMIRKIIDNIPKEYLNKTLLLPHPLFLDKLKNTDLNYLIPNILSYDKILEDTALLITDYSSIAYSAFYRGANVIFCFEELAQCMNEYKGHLMLNETNIFGDISYQFNDLKKLVKNNYLKPQSTLYKKRYKKLVEFDDNKNTERLIKLLKKDRFI